MNTLDKVYIEQAYKYASVHSHDPDTHSGCVIKLESGEVFFGANRLPVGVRFDNSFVKRPLKYSYLEHCERDAIAQITKEGLSTKGATLWVNWKPCMDCARMMVNSGFSRVVIHKEGQETYEQLANIVKGGDWHDEIDTIEFMRAVGIHVDYLSMDFGKKVIGRFRGVNVTL